MQGKYANDFKRSTKNYITDLSDKKYQPISFELERELIEKSKSGNNAAIKQLMESHLRLVVSIAKRYTRNGVEILDLIQEGNLGLYEALKRFDSTKEARFCAYAKWWIEKYVKEAVCNNRVINNNEILILDSDDENSRTEDEIFFDAQVKEKDCQDPFEDNDEREENHVKVIEDLLSSLDKRTRFVIESCYGLNGSKCISMVELAKKMGISPERVRQLRNKGMITLKSYAVMHSISSSNCIF